jgi:hypothetical protein
MVHFRNKNVTLFLIFSVFLDMQDINDLLREFISSLLTSKTKINLLARFQLTKNLEIIRLNVMIGVRTPTPLYQ